MGTVSGSSPESAGECCLTSRDRLIVALDLPTLREAEAMVERLGDSVSFYKVGYQLAFAGGLAFVDELIRARQAGLPRHEAA